MGQSPQTPVDFEQIAYGLDKFEDSNRLRISSTLQTVVLGPSFRGFGKRPSFTPAHQVDLETGMGPTGAHICLTRTRPVVGNSG